MPGCPETPFVFLLLAGLGLLFLVSVVIWLAGWGVWIYVTRDMKVTHAGQIKRRLFR